MNLDSEQTLHNLDFGSLKSAVAHVILFKLFLFFYQILILVLINELL